MPLSTEAGSRVEGKTTAQALMLQLCMMTSDHWCFVVGADLSAKVGRGETASELGPIRQFGGGCTPTRAAPAAGQAESVDQRQRGTGHARGLGFDGVVFRQKILFQRQNNGQPVDQVSTT